MSKIRLFFGTVQLPLTGQHIYLTEEDGFSIVVSIRLASPPEQLTWWRSTRRKSTLTRANSKRFIGGEWCGGHWWPLGKIVGGVGGGMLSQWGGMERENLTSCFYMYVYFFVTFSLWILLLNEFLFVFQCDYPHVECTEQHCGCGGCCCPLQHHQLSHGCSWLVSSGPCCRTGWPNLW